MLSTQRLNITIATDEEMRSLILNTEDAELKEAYNEMLAGCMEHPERRQWYAVWFVALKDGQQIGDLSFKGLSDNGMAEIGYGLLPAFWGKGYATEAVKAMVDWALQQPGLKTIEAETEPNNRASQRVLEKVGFLPTGRDGEEGPRFAYC